MVDFDALSRVKQGQPLEVNGVQYKVVNVYKGIKVNIVKELTLEGSSGEIFVLQLIFNNKSLAFWKEEMDPKKRKPSYQNPNLIPIESVNIL